MNDRMVFLYDSTKYNSQMYGYKTIHIHAKSINWFGKSETNLL